MMELDVKSYHIKISTFYFVISIFIIVTPSRFLIHIYNIQRQAPIGLSLALLLGTTKTQSNVNNKRGK